MLSLLDKIPVAPTLQQLIGVVIILVTTFVAMFIVRIILNGVVKKITSRTKTDLDDKLLESIQKQIYFLIYLFGLTLLFNYLQKIFVMKIGVEVFRFFDSIFFAAAVILIAIVLVKVFSTIFRWYAVTIAAKTETKVDDEFLPLLDRATKVIIYVLSTLIVLDHFHIDIKGLITVLGVGSLAVALAAQDTIANMIGGFVIMIDRPFRNGDWVRLSDGNTCRVYQIGVRSTKFLTFENTLIIVPNAELVKTTVHNITYPYPEIRVKIDVGVSYDAKIEQVKNIMLEEADKHPKVLKEPKPFFRFLEFGESSLNVSMFCRVKSIQDLYITGSELRKQILNRFREEGIEIPFPQRVIKLINDSKQTKDN